MSLSSVLLLTALAAPQEPIRPAFEPLEDGPRPQLSVVTGALRRGVVEPTRLGFGTGGFAAEVLAKPFAAAEAAASRRTPAAASSEIVTPGGARIVARAVGVRVELPSGAGLVVDAEGRVHTRSHGGARSRPHRDGVRLRLGDGSRITLLPSAHRDRPPQLVTYAPPAGTGRVQVLSRSREAMRLRRRTLDRVRELWVLGEGEDVFRAVAIGPLLVMDRVTSGAGRIARSTSTEQLPMQAVVVLGDVLGASLLRLPRHVQLHTSGARDLEQRATGLARAARVVLPPRASYLRPQQGSTDPEIEIGGGARLRVRAVAGGMPRLLLLGPGETQPVAEWSVTRDTILHLLDEHEDRSGETSQHYAIQGLRLNDLTERLLGYEVPSAEQGRARTLLFAAVAAPPAVRRGG